MEGLASHSQTKTKDSTTSSMSFLKRRHNDAFPQEDADQEEDISPSKKPRPLAPEILPRIHHLHSPPQEPRRKRKAASDRDHRRKSAGRKALVQSQQQIGLLQAPTLNQLGNKKKDQLLKIAQNSSEPGNHSEDLASPPLAQTPSPSTVSDTDDPQTTKDNVYAILEDGKYRFDLDEVAYELLDEVSQEVSAHIKWLDEVDRSVCADIEEYVLLNPRYRCLTAEQQHHKMMEYSRELDAVYNQNWHETCQDIPFDPPNDDSPETQVAMAIAMAAHLNPLPTDVAADEIETFVEEVQRKGIEHHRAHNRNYLYTWKDNVRKVRMLNEAEEGQQDVAETEGKEVAIDPLLLSAGNGPIGVGDEATGGDLPEFDWPFFS